VQCRFGLSDVKAASDEPCISLHLLRKRHQSTRVCCFFSCFLPAQPDRHNASQIFFAQKKKVIFFLLDRERAASARLRSEQTTTVHYALQL
jgi:hypothetical protein